jgi:hypothetical protein
MELLLALMDAANAIGYQVYVPDYGGTRTAAQQSALYSDALAQGGGTDTAYAVAKPGHSRHEYGAAFDLQIFGGGHASGGKEGTDVDYKILADLAENLGLVGGYYFAARGVGKKDPFHFQLNEALSTSVARWQAMKAAGIQSTREVLLARSRSLHSSASPSGSSRGNSNA